MVHVLVYGEVDSGVTDSLRLGIFREPLLALGVDVRTWSSFPDDALLGGGGGLTALDWADVLLFRRWRPTHLVCTECESAWADLASLEAHVRASGHRTMVPDPTLRPLVDLLDAHRELIASKAVVYDTDDDVLDYPEWTGFARAAARERDLVLRILALADLVTVATPVLAERLAPHTRAPVRVVRNAIDPGWYEGAATSGRGGAGDPDAPVRILYHGVPVRWRDYQLAKPAVDALAGDDARRIRRIWIGAAEEPRVRRAVDEAIPWADGLRPFAAALVAARPDVGLAPLLDEPFNRAKSELHWLEYSLAGAVTVASGFDGPGPYDPIREGVDGLVARTPADWTRHLRELADSADLRAELAGRAGERVRAEYSVAVRAVEWADAFRWAAEHPGSGRTSGTAVVAVESPAPAEDVGRILVLGPGAASVSDELRFLSMAPALRRHGFELECWSPGNVPDPSIEFDMVEAALARADVVVFRRSYRTYHACLACGTRTLDRAEIRAHAHSTRHEVVESPFALIRPLVQLLEADRVALGHRAILYDTDDDFLAADLPPGAEDLLERDLVERILALADVVTVATRVLAARLAGRTPAPIHLIRNALDPAWYGPRRAEAGDEIRILHHGAPSRIAEYELARAAVDAVAATDPLVRRVWLGAEAGTPAAAAADEVRPWVNGIAPFAVVLAAARPDIGVAPLRDTPYNRSRSELHWLEYSLAGAATIASGFDGPGPYDPIRDGVDGLIARSPADWERHLRALVASADLRLDLAAGAQARVVADYSLEARAPEWAQVYLQAIERAAAR